MGLLSGFVNIAMRVWNWNRLDGEGCIRLLLDKEEDIVERDAAAESLMYYPVPQAVDALYQIASDSSEYIVLRETAAGSLGHIWAQVGIDKDRLERLQPEIRFEVEASIPREKKEVDEAS